MQESEACLVVTCGSCEWEALTTNTNHAAFDQGPYTVWTKSSDRRKLISTIATGLGIGTVRARAMVDAAEPLETGIGGARVLELAKLMRSKGIEVSVEPEFPWDLETGRPNN